MAYFILDGLLRPAQVWFLSSIWFVWLIWFIWLVSFNQRTR